MGRRDRALIALIVYTFARIGAATGTHVEDYFIQGRRGWMRLHEKGGKRHDVPAHHALDAHLESYVKGALLETNPKGPLFCTAVGKTDRLTARPMRQADAYRMIHRRAKAAGIQTNIGCHTFQATGITAYLKMVAVWRWRSRSLPMSRHGPRGCTTGAAMTSALMKSRRSSFERHPWAPRCFHD